MGKHVEWAVGHTRNTHADVTTRDDTTNTNTTTTANTNTNTKPKGVAKL